MEPPTDSELEVPQALFKLLSKAAATNGRTMEDEIVAQLAASIDSEQERTIDNKH